MSAIWNIGDCEFDAAELAARVKALCCACGQVHDALQAPADALIQWYCSQRLKVFKKLDRAGDKLVVSILTTAYAIRDQLGQAGPLYPGMPTAADAAPDEGHGESAPSASDAPPLSSGASDVYTPAPGMCAAAPDESDVAPDAMSPSAATTAVPVDWDQPNVLLFDERQAPWHAQMDRFYGGALSDLLKADTLKGAILSRESAAAARRAADPAAYSSYASSDSE